MNNVTYDWQSYLKQRSLIQITFCVAKSKERIKANGCIKTKTKGAINVHQVYTRCAGYEEKLNDKLKARSLEDLYNLTARWKRLKEYILEHARDIAEEKEKMKKWIEEGKRSKNV